jgi:hypothetical protein
VNNTIVNASDGRWCININTGSTGNVVRNNILYTYHSFRGAISIDSSSRPGFVAQSNAGIDRYSVNGGNSVITLAAFQALGYGAGSLVADPAALFVETDSDFHLREDAPVVDAGTASSAPSVDLDGNSRPAGAGFDIGAYERTSAGVCGDGQVDPSEECGEPGASCGEGEACQACSCMNEPSCSSGIAISRPRLGLRGDELRLRVRGEAVIPKPWTEIDPATNGIRIVVDALSGPGGIDVTLPGGSAWILNADGDRWLYRDPTGAVSGITRATVRDLSAKQDGLLFFSLQGKSDQSLPLPEVSRVRTSAILGAPDECAAVEWGGPSDLSPRCTLRGARLVCR